VAATAMADRPGPDLRAPPAPAATFGLAAAAGASLVARGAPGGGQ
jgi:hypothetical protein